MDVKEAALLIGMSEGQVRVLVRNHKIAATQIECKFNRMGYVWQIDEKSAKAYADTPQKVGFPRGESRG